MKKIQFIDIHINESTDTADGRSSFFNELSPNNLQVSSEVETCKLFSMGFLSIEDRRLYNFSYSKKIIQP